MTRAVILSGDFQRARALERVAVEAAVDVAIATRVEDVLALCGRGSCDVVLLDGIAWQGDLAAACGRIGACAGGAPVLVLSEGSDPACRLASLAAGADEVLLAPFRPVDLVARLSCLADLKGRLDLARRCALSPSPAAATRPPPRLLVLDPQDRSRERLSEVLSGEGEVVAVGDPARGLIEGARARFDAVWVSLDWPQGNGFALCRTLRRLDGAGSTRILALAGGGDVSFRTLAENGIDDLMARPVDRCEALARTRLALRRGALARHQQAPAPVVPLHPPRGGFALRSGRPDDRAPSDRRAMGAS